MLSEVVINFSNFNIFEALNIRVSLANLRNLTNTFDLDPADWGVTNPNGKTAIISMNSIPFAYSTMITLRLAIN